MILFGLIGIFGFMGGFVSTIAARGVNDDTLTATVRFPLSIVKGACIDSSGRIYCLTDFYKRIQVYDRNGHFLRGWFVPFDKVDPGIDIDRESRIIAYNVSLGKRLTYTLQGKPLAKNDMSEEDKKTLGELDHRPYLKSLDGGTYLLDGNVIYRIDPKSGVRSVVLADPWYLSWTKGPLPAWLYLLLSIVGLVVLERKKL